VNKSITPLKALFDSMDGVIQTWQQRLGNSPHIIASGAVGEAMQAEIDELRAALSQQTKPTHYLDAMGLCYTAARAQFIGMDVDTMVALYRVSNGVLKPEQAWQPISSAPKDGTEIILGSEDDTMVFGLWSKAIGKWLTDSGEPMDWATHWMHRPTPPNGDVK
jgi:hypothetical protein